MSNQGTASPKTVILVRWEFPTQNWFKLNSDGSALGCPGLAGGGGLIRDHQGRWVKGYIRFIGWANIIEAELWAIRDGLIVCLQLQVQAIEIELDAKSVIHLLSNNEVSMANYAPITLKYWRGWEGAAPESDAATCASVRCLSFFIFYFLSFFSDSCRLGFDSTRIGPY